MIKSFGICIAIVLAACVGFARFHDAVVRAQETPKQVPKAAPKEAPKDAPPARPARRHAPPAPDPAADRGRKQFEASCGFCHAPDATGARGPDLIRSPLVAHDAKGDLIGGVVRNGRPDKGMPALGLTDDQIADVAAFLHMRVAEVLSSSQVPEGYALQRMLTGNADAGKAFFEGAGGCRSCHSVTGDLAGVAEKYSPIDLEAHMLYPEGHHVTVTVTTGAGEKVEGPLKHIDDFVVALEDGSGWYRSFPRDEVKVDVHDHLAAHRALLDTMTQNDVHNLFAYLETLK
jgi:cytochrome c oxidase cbb3-type subunit 3